MIYAYRDGKFVRSFETLNECAEILGVDRTACSKHLNRHKHRNHIAGYILYKEKPDIKIAMADSVRITDISGLPVEKLLLIYKIL